MEVIEATTKELIDAPVAEGEPTEQLVATILQNQPSTTQVIIDTLNSLYQKLPKEEVLPVDFENLILDLEMHIPSHINYYRGSEVELINWLLLTVTHYLKKSNKGNTEEFKQVVESLEELEEFLIGIKSALNTEHKMDKTQPINPLYSPLDAQDIQRARNFADLEDLMFDIFLNFKGFLEINFKSFGISGEKFYQFLGLIPESYTLEENAFVGRVNHIRAFVNQSLHTSSHIQVVQPVLLNTIKSFDTELKQILERFNEITGKSRIEQ